MILKINAGFQLVRLGCRSLSSLTGLYCAHTTFSTLLFPSVPSLGSWRLPEGTAPVVSAWPPNKAKLYLFQILLQGFVGFATFVCCCYVGLRGPTLVYWLARTHYVDQGGPKLGNAPPPSASQGAGITGMHCHSGSNSVILSDLISGNP